MVDLPFTIKDTEAHRILRLTLGAWCWDVTNLSETNPELLGIMNLHVWNNEPFLHFWITSPLE